MGRRTFFGDSVVESVFPDGQPHVEVLRYDGNLRCRVASADDLLKVCLVLSLYRKEGKHTQLEIMYLLGERMDKPNAQDMPVTAAVVCDILRGYSDAATFYLLSPHSGVVEKRLAAATLCFQEAVFHDNAIKMYLKQQGRTDQELDYRSTSDVSIVFPDKGASSRLKGSPLLDWWAGCSHVICEKQRDLQTGRITGFSIIEGTPQQHCIILDDLCDGGATFVGAARCLRDAGAQTVGLSVVKGVFSKGTTLDGIDFIATTNAYQDFDGLTTPSFYVHRYL